MRERRRSTSRRLAGLALGLCLAAGWFAWLRPTSLGGDLSYVVVQGSSMEPTYRDGDLVIVREEDRYEQGDIIAFRAGGDFNDTARIIHRIVGDAGNGEFRTRGDNRDRVDPWSPGPEDIIGKAVWDVPRLGGFAVRAGQPEVLGALGAFAVVVGGQRRRRKRRMSALPPAWADGPMPPTHGPRPSGPTAPRWLRQTEPRWAFIGLVGAVALALPMIVALWSTIRASDTTTELQQVGSLDLAVDADYQFSGNPSAVYPTGVVGTRDDGAGLRVPTSPLYSRLLHELDVRFTFDAGAEGVEDLTSTYAVDAAVTMPEGWTSALQSVEPTSFEGTTTELVTLDLDDVAARVAEVATLTGVGGDHYEITLIPRLVVDGSTGAAPVHDEFAPALKFVVKNTVIEAQPAADTRGSQDLVREVRHGARYGIGPISVGIDTARGLFSGVVLVLVVAAAYCASVLFGGVGLRESQRIAARYRSQLVDVSSATGPPGPVVMVGGIDELARLAKVEQSVILHEDLGDGSHRYRVFLGPVTYEYETAPEHGGGAAETDADAPRPGATSDPQPPKT